ncbi:uncharacterized protein Cht6 [Halyomorpha halys]|uniref:uncharacterized protein Cht6 n=1 Tax=Halyomorpha halys TaxID=286706 RepID=UPI0006D522E4|nr:uncharacterized protein LOC106681525 [Halyomorpha halys]
MRLAHAILAATFLAISNQHEITKRSSDGEKKVVCYYTNWSVYRPGTAKFNPQNINPYLCTHLIYAFGGLDRENGLRPYDKYQDIEQGGYAKFTGLKTYNKQLKTLLAIGGWNEGSARFSPLVADEERRKEFVRNVVKFLRQNHFDGLDLDWEYPAYRDGGKPKDKENYAQLVQELREEFEKESSKTGRPRLLLTMAVPAGIEYIDKGYDLPKLNRYLDFFNILSYDYHSAFEPSVNHHSPLYSMEEESEYNFDSQLTIDATIKHYLMKGADAEKLVLGIPTYGRSYTLFNPDSTDLGSPADGPGEQGEATREKGYLAYYEICNNIKDGWTVVQPKESAMGPYAYKGNQWVGYDDESISRKKAEYVNQRNLGGIMFWSIDNDDFRGKCHSRAYPLIEAAKEALIGKGVSNKLPSSTRGGKTTKAGKIKTTARTTTTPAPPRSNTTPEPPTTPDPGSDFVCKDEGFFPHPRDCKKYFWCLDSGPSDLGIVAHQFTCPSGLFFNKAADSCDFARNVICKKKSTTTTTTTTTAAPKTTKASPGKITLPPKTTSLPRTTTTTTTTTTEAPFEEDEEEEEDRDNAEDPQAIKQLIALIKKLGGVAELEKQLEASSGTDSTTPAISKSLYRKVLNSGTSRYQNIQRNGPSGPQNEGLPRESPRSSFRRDKPQYVTIRRERPSTTTESSDIVYAEVEDDGGVEEEDVKEGVKEGFKYKTINRNRFGQNSGTSGTEKPERPKYQPSERFRSKLRTEEVPKNEERSTTLKYTSILRSRPTTADSSATTSKYVILQRQRTPKPQAEEDVATTENELNDDEEVTEHVIETTTPRPRVKIQTRTRRPFRKTIVRAQTTTTTEAPTTVKQRTTIESLRQRLNRFKTERNFSKNSITSPSPFSKEFTSAISENPLQTSKPVRKEFRKLIRPLPFDDSQLDASHDVSKNTPQNEIRIRKVSKPLEQVTEGSQFSEEYTDEEPLVLPDLANVAVAAIQSLATSSPIPTTEQYKSPTIERTTRKAIVRKRPAVRPTVSTPPKSSPRPFAKVHYDEYEDYFAEPVDVPLSGKVRIHNDGYIECLDIGNFPHPFSCRKFISCAKMENSNLLGWEYTCPKGLSFDPIGGICNWNAGLGCKE